MIRAGHKPVQWRMFIYRSIPGRTPYCIMRSEEYLLKMEILMFPLSKIIRRVLKNTGQCNAKNVLQRAALICGIEESEIRQAASFIGNAKGYISLWTMGLNQSVIGVNKNFRLINLNLITGHIGKPGSGPFSLTGQPNAMGRKGSWWYANLLPAHRDLFSAADRES